MIKVSLFEGSSPELGPQVIPLFGPADGVFEKTAAPQLLPEVVGYIASLRPRPDAQYVLINAMGAGEYYGSNVNGDYFSEASLIHAPDDWSHNPLLDRIKSKDWSYGYPTFYYAKPFLHHRNKPTHPHFGEIELAAWNPRMKRVELISRVDKKLCDENGGTGIWDKLRNGEYPDVSMGCKVPFDTCSICLDWDTYRKAQATFDPKRHAHPGMAVLEWHKKNPIRGVSITRKDYCEHAARMMNKILPDGRKVFVYNDYPRFFDISFVFIGADKTAKVMMHVSKKSASVGSAEVAESLGYKDEKPEDEIKVAFIGKDAKNKEGEITKDVVPSQFAGKAVPLLTRGEPDLPRDVLDALGCQPLANSLSTATGLGIILRPREFQRVVLTNMGKGQLADEYDSSNVVFPRSADSSPVDMGPDFFSPGLARMLLPLLAGRSILAPMIEQRVVVVLSIPEDQKKNPSSHSSDLLRKMGSAYNTYRNGVMDLVSHAQSLIASATSPEESALHKISSATVEETFTPLSAAYIKLAFWDEVGLGVSTAGAVEPSQVGNVEKGRPSRNTWN
jgi:hypothetical protein